MSEEVNKEEFKCLAALNEEDKFQFYVNFETLVEISYRPDGGVSVLFDDEDMVKILEETQDAEPSGLTRCMFVVAKIRKIPFIQDRKMGDDI